MPQTDLDSLSRVVYRLAERLGVANPLAGDLDAALMQQADQDLATLAADVAKRLDD
jgi:hypothetical protein